MAVKRTVLAVVLLATALVLSGCGTLAYYWQGIAGHLDLMRRARPVAAVAGETSDPSLKARLDAAMSIRRFASDELALPDNGSYTRYADLERPYVVWNVFAAPEFSLTPRQWCFPVAGCVNYRGYFDENAAKDEAARLAAAGDDVHVGGVPAYSTLGYFEDPLLSTFIRYREPDLARLIFHELAHQVAYAKDDSGFNESFAVAVEEEGLARWLAAQRDRPDVAQLAAQVAKGNQRRVEFRTLIRDVRDRLEVLYASDVTADARRAGKAELFAEMRLRYAQMKASWGGGPAFDRWFAGGANNAGIAAVGLYADHVEQFRELLAAEGGDLPRFYTRVRTLVALPKAERDAALSAARPMRNEAGPGQAPGMATKRIALF